MKRSVALLSVVAVFVVGVAIGIVGTHLFYAQEFRRPGGPPGLMGRSFVDRLEGHLDLTGDQRRQIDAILERSHEEAEMLRHEMQPRLRELFETTGAEIDAILTPEAISCWGRWASRHPWTRCARPCSSTSRARRWSTYAAVSTPSSPYPKSTPSVWCSRASASARSSG